MRNALILGCSHAAGALMHEEPGLVLPAEPNKDQYQVETEYGARNSYPVVLSEILGYAPHNHAISGGSNDAMLRIFLEQQQKFDLIIACWTGHERGELWHPDHEYWVPINVGHNDSFTIEPNEVLKQGRNVLTKLKNYELYEQYGKQWLIFEGNYQRGFNNKIKNILALNTMAKCQGIPVINLDSFQGIHHQFPWPKDIFRPLPGHRLEFCNYCDAKEFPKEPRGHYFRAAHKDYAQFIKRKLDKAGAKF